LVRGDALLFLIALKVKFVVDRGRRATFSARYLGEGFSEFSQHRCSCAVA
jgi:hypothetical protein